MPVKDIFRRNYRWDTVGLDCGNCIYFQGPKIWPDVNKEVKCNYHNVSLSFILSTEGYLAGEYFCKEYKDNGKAFKDAIEDFINVRDKLENNILYGFYSKTGNLEEYDLAKMKTNKEISN